MMALALLTLLESAAAQEPVWSEWRYAMPFAHPGGAAAIGTAHAPEEGLAFMGLDADGPDLATAEPLGLLPAPEESSGQSSPPRDISSSLMPSPSLEDVAASTATAHTAHQPPKTRRILG